MTVSVVASFLVCCFLLGPLPAPPSLPHHRLSSSQARAGDQLPEPWRRRRPEATKTTSSLLPALQHQGGTGETSVSTSSFLRRRHLHYFPFHVSFSLFDPDSLVKTEESKVVKVKANMQTQIDLKVGATCIFCMLSHLGLKQKKPLFQHRLSTK